jgi:hypothetical protein
MSPVVGCMLCLSYRVLFLLSLTNLRISSLVLLWEALFKLTAANIKLRGLACRQVPRLKIKREDVRFWVVGPNWSLWCDGSRVCVAVWVAVVFEISRNKG